MPLRRSQLKRLTAALLPMMFLWLCAACVSICGQETAAASDHALASTSAEFAQVRDSPPDCDGCPFVAFPKAISTDRATLTDSSQTPAAAAPAIPPAGAPFDYPAFDKRPRRPPPSDPPLELISTLRI